VVYDNGSDIASAVKTAEDADVAVVFVATSSHEGADRSNLSLAGGQDELIAAVAKAQRKTVVVASTPGAILTPWRNKVSALLVNFMPGQEMADATAELLFGDTSPSGRLPLTFPNSENEQKMTTSQYPGLPVPPPSGNLTAVYSEKLNFGYRWYHTHDVKPAFAFGFGLSYSAFKYSDIAVHGRSISVNVTNTGDRAACDVPQVYLSYPDSAGEPVRQLRGFTKVFLKPMESTTVSFELSERDLSVWDSASHAWVVAPGRFSAYVGSSSSMSHLAHVEL